MTHFLRVFITSAVLTATSATASAQAMYFNHAAVDSSVVVPAPTAFAKDPAVTEILNTEPDSTFYIPRELDELHAYLDTMDLSGYEVTWSDKRLPAYFFRPSVFVEHRFREPLTLENFGVAADSPTLWLDQENRRLNAMNDMFYDFFSKNPYDVTYNINLLPEAPKRYQAVVDPQEHTIEIKEIASVTTAAPTIQAAEVQKRHWIKTFNASLHFSQAYISPNWYQGGNSNLNVLGNIYYNVKLNPKYHPNLLFENTFQYKIGINSTPEDQYHKYNISDDLFQINSILGIKAVKRWYYTFTLQFKTQLFKSYDVNSTTMRSSFLSPGELIFGIGMSYNYANEKKTVTLDASIAPVSYSLRTCIDPNIDPTRYNVEAGHKVKNSFGSSGEVKFFWQICHNISYRTRVFAFTDYSSLQADWENTFTFDINRFLTTQIFFNARYDTKTPPVKPNEDGTPSKWKKLQMKEILSIGFTYKFSSI